MNIFKIFRLQNLYLLLFSRKYLLITYKTFIISSKALLFNLGEKLIIKFNNKFSIIIIGIFWDVLYSFTIARYFKISTPINFFSCSSRTAIGFIDSL